MEALALVDVDSESPKETWSLLLDAIRNAHFTALDLVSTLSTPRTSPTLQKNLFSSHIFRS